MDAHRHCPHCGISMRPTATACDSCFVSEVRDALDRLRQGEHVDVDEVKQAAAP